MRLSLRTSITLAIAVPLVAGVAGVAIATTSRAAAERRADLDEDLAARAAALASYAAFADDGYTVDFEGGPGPAPDVTASLVAWQVLPGGDGAPLFVGGAFTLPAEAVPVATAEEVSLADWPRPWRVGSPVLHTVADGGDGSVRVWSGRFLVRVERGDVEMMRGLPDDLDEHPTVVVRVAERLEPMRWTDPWALRLLGWTALLSLASVGLGALLSHRIAQPLRRLAHDAQAVVVPTSEPPLAVHGGEEVEALARSLNDAFVRLHDAYARQARFAADASHELRTPLTLIRTEAEVTLRLDHLEPAAREAVEGIVEGAERMQEVLDGLLLLTRAGAGLPASAGPVDLFELASAELRAAQAQDRPTLEVHGGPTVVTGVASQLRIVVRNLVENAVRHTPAAGRIDVEVGSADGHVVLQVRDTGEGIAAADLPHVFERFYVADPARRRSRSGSGLGLAIVEAIVEQHGGHVAVESQPDVGTTLVVRLPAA